jgi:hypothetical protein
MVEAIILPLINTKFQVGDNHTLICNASGADNLDPNISYKWTKNSSNQVKSNSRTLSLNILRLSDAGSYTCSVAVTSAYLGSSIIKHTTKNVNIESKCQYRVHNIIMLLTLFLTFMQCPVQKVFLLQASVVLVDFNLFLTESARICH